MRGPPSSWLDEAICESRSGSASGAMRWFSMKTAPLLSIEQVRTLFEERASLLQDYDTGATGRFGRHLLGALLVLDHPFGIGPLQFSSFFPEDPHNSFLLSFTAGGWLGGCVFIALVLLTLRIGWKQVFMPTPWQGTAIAIYAFFVGEVAESYFIDVQHWRHFYLIIGAIWGLAIAARLRYRSRLLVRPQDPLTRPQRQQPCLGIFR